jgi:hypothetical protein
MASLLAAPQWRCIKPRPILVDEIGLCALLTHCASTTGHQGKTTNRRDSLQDPRQLERAVGALAFGTTWHVFFVEKMNLNGVDRHNWVNPARIVGRGCIVGV